jgi:hypothetical protein
MSTGGEKPPETLETLMSLMAGMPPAHRALDVAPEADAPHETSPCPRGAHEGRSFVPSRDGRGRTSQGCGMAKKTYIPLCAHGEGVDADKEWGLTQPGVPLTGAS